MGGLARKATIIDNLIDEGLKPIILDSGNLFYKNNQIDPGITEETAKINAETIAASYNKIGCDAFSPGSKDFALGFKDLMKLYNKSDFDYVSCNIFYKNNPSKLLFKPYKIIKRGNYKIGIIGLSSVFSADGIVVENPINTLNKIIDDVDEKSDIIILLFNSIDQDLNKLYDQEGLNIDLIIKSNDSATRSHDGGGNIPTFLAGNRGKVLYKFSLSFQDIQLPLIDIAWCNNTMKRVSSRLDKMKKGDVNVDLEKLYANDLTTLKRIENYKNQIMNAEDLLSNAVNSLTFEKFELSKNIFDKPSILKIIDRGKNKIRDLEGDLLSPYVPPGG